MSLSTTSGSVFFGGGGAFSVRASLLVVLNCKLYKILMCIECMWDVAVTILRICLGIYPRIVLSLLILLTTSKVGEGEE